MWGLPQPICREMGGWSRRFTRLPAIARLLHSMTVASTENTVLSEVLSKFFHEVKAVMPEIPPELQLAQEPDRSVSKQQIEA